MYLANGARSKLAGITPTTPDAAGRRDRQGRERTPHRHPQRLGRRARAQGDAADPLRAAARAGARRPERSARRRRHDDAGPDVGRAVAGLPGAAAAGRADRRASASARRSTSRSTSPRSGSRAASATTGSASSATRRGSTASWAAAAPSSSSPTTTIPQNKGLLRAHHASRGQSRARRCSMTASAALHRLPAGQPGEADRAGGRHRRSAARARHRRQGQPHPPRHLRAGPRPKHELIGPRPSLARDPRAGRASGRLRPLRQAAARRRGEPVSRLRRHAVDGGAHRPRAIARAPMRSAR